VKTTARDKIFDGHASELEMNAFVEVRTAGRGVRLRGPGHEMVGGETHGASDRRVSRGAGLGGAWGSRGGPERRPTAIFRGAVKVYVSTAQSTRALRDERSGAV